MISAWNAANSLSGRLPVMNRIDCSWAYVSRAVFNCASRSASSAVKFTIGSGRCGVEPSATYWRASTSNCV